MGIKQTPTVKNERQADLYVFTLRKFVEAAGRTLELGVELPGTGPFTLISSWRDWPNQARRLVSFPQSLAFPRGRVIPYRHDHNGPRTTVPSGMGAAALGSPCKRDQLG
ncbi:hypothetical protein GGQ81_003385 [Sphingomonas desiccabilis]|nr:hypothetical protein [Sphingomonas desiccabilis]